MSTPRHRHPVNQALIDNAPLGARIADAVTGFMGSWRFLILQSILVALWIGGNILLFFHFDAFPFILLNLAFSTQAAYAAPIILLAGTGKRRETAPPWNTRRKRQTRSLNRTWNCFAEPRRLLSALSEWSA